MHAALAPLGRVTNHRFSYRNDILRRQRIYQADPRPVYLRLPGAKLYYGAFLGVFWTGIFGITLGTFYQITVCFHPDARAKLTHATG